MNRLHWMVAGLALVAVCDSAMAERVYVKARGEVDLAPFKCETIARSPNVRRICYDEQHEYALVSLSGIWYHYCGVPASTIREWRSASSKGRYYNDNVRSNFDCTAPGASVPPSR
jgi:KTSC domain